jgi:hypothetical protein
MKSALAAVSVTAVLLLSICAHLIISEHAQIARDETALNQSRTAVSLLEAQNMTLHNQVVDSVQTAVQLRGAVESKIDDAATASSAATTASERLDVCEAAAREIQAQQQQGPATTPLNPAIVALVKAFLR